MHLIHKTILETRVDSTTKILPKKFNTRTVRPLFTTNCNIQGMFIIFQPRQGHFEKVSWCYTTLLSFRESILNKINETGEQGTRDKIFAHQLWPAWYQKSCF